MIGDILQPTHLIFIFVVALLVLGPKRLPEVGRSLGKGIRDFRGAMAGIEDQAREVFDTAPPDAGSSQAVPAATISRVSGSGSSSAEPDPADYAD